MAENAATISNADSVLMPKLCVHISCRCGTPVNAHSAAGQLLVFQCPEHNPGG